MFSEKDGTLDLNFRGSYKAVEPLQAMFATEILKLPGLPPDARDTRVYDLNPLRELNFQFIYDPTSGIQSVVEKKLRLLSRIGQGERITLEADAIRSAALYDLVDKVGQSVPLRLHNVTQAEIQAKMAWNPTSPPNQ